MLEMTCETCHRKFIASRRSQRFCKPSCRQKNYRRSKRPAQDIAYFEDQAKDAIWAITSFESQGRRVKGTLKMLWIEIGSQLLGLGVTREELRELLIK